MYLHENKILVSFFINLFYCFIHFLLFFFIFLFLFPFPFLIVYFLLQFFFPFFSSSQLNATSFFFPSLIPPDIQFQFPRHITPIHTVQNLIFRPTLSFHPSTPTHAPTDTLTIITLRNVSTYYIFSQLCQFPSFIAVAKPIAHGGHFNFACRIPKQLPKTQEDICTAPPSTIFFFFFVIVVLIWLSSRQIFILHYHRSGQFI